MPWPACHTHLGKMGKACQAVTRRRRRSGEISTASKLFTLPFFISLSLFLWWWSGGGVFFLDSLEKKTESAWHTAHCTTAFLGIFAFLVHGSTEREERRGRKGKGIGGLPLISSSSPPLFSPAFPCPLLSLLSLSKREGRRRRHGVMVMTSTIN